MEDEIEKGRGYSLVEAPEIKKTVEPFKTVGGARFESAAAFKTVGSARVEPAKTVERARDVPAANSLKRKRENTFQGEDAKTAKIERVEDSANLKSAVRHGNVTDRSAIRHGNVTDAKSSVFPTAVAEWSKAACKSKEEEILAASGDLERRIFATHFIGHSSGVSGEEAVRRSRRHQPQRREFQYGDRGLGVE
eukprot:12415499-Karenia_brevis.AAC.1